MIDSTDKKEEEKEEETINDHDESSGNGGNNNDEGDDLVNGKEGIPGGEYGKFYEQYLYRLLPAIYQEFDTKKENNVLQEFLKIIASQAAAIRQDIDGLLNNYFINSCEEWVIPYIADLIAAKVVPNSSLNNRLDVQNMIRWRKLKGTQTGLVDLITNTINHNAKVKESFRYCSSTSHLAFKSSDIVVNKTHSFVDLHDQNALSDIDTENDITPHTIDVRDPTQTSGWYNIKNVLLFMPQLNTYHISQVQAEREENGLGYYFSNLVRKQQQQPSSSSSSSSHTDHFPLYDLDEGVKITGASFAQDPFKYFGKKRGMSVKIDNILAACPSAPIFFQEVNSIENRVTTITTATAEPNRGSSNNNYDEGHQDNYDGDNSSTSTTGDPDFVSLHKAEGIRILEPRKFSRSDTPFIIRLYCYCEERGPIEIANYNTYKMSYRMLPRSKLKKIASGTILISIEVASEIGKAAEFPETVIAIRDSRSKSLVEDSILSKYKNALYVYLPSILVNYEDDDKKRYFFVDRNGSTYEVQMNNGRYDSRSYQLGPAKANKNLRTRTAPSSQIYPPRQLTYSMRPLRNFAELNRFTGIKAVDTKRYGTESFVIEAIAINHDKKQAWKIGKLEINGGGSLSYVNEKEVWIRWRIIVGDTSYNNYKEYFLPASHFKATRLDLQIEEIVESVLPEEIVPEDALDVKVGTYRIDRIDHRKPNPDNTYEYGVKIIIKDEYREQFEYLVNEIKDAIEEKPEFENEGKLLLRISKKTTKKTTTTTQGDFPLSEIILTNGYGRSVLVYLPQHKFDKIDEEYDLYVADDGSTSCDEDLLNPARKSAGQIIPIANKYPMQHRIPVYVNLADWQSVDTTTTVPSGELAIDPEHGRFAFSRDDGDDAQSMHVTADYNYAFSHDIGVGAYDRRASLKKNATKWVSKYRHTYHKDAFPSKIFKTIAEALASAEDDDVIQIEDSGIYDEGDNISNITLPPGVRVVTLQAANLTMPTIKVNERLKLNSSNSVKRINLNGITITGGPLTLHENFDKISLISCTVNPGYDDDNKRSLGIRIEQQEKQEEGEQNQEYNADATTTTTTTIVTNTDSRYATQKSNKASLKEISLIKSISGGIVVDDSVSLISLEDSIVHNLGGHAILVKENNNKKEKNPILKLEATRSNILSKYPDDEYADNYVLELKDICARNCILTNRVSVKLNEKQEEKDKTENDDDSSCTSSLRYSRFEQGSFENLGKDNNAIVDCTIERPIFISTTFGHPAYLHLDHLSSKSILEGAENTLEMGAFNKSYKPLRMRNLNLRLQEFLPIGIKGGIVYTY